MNLDKILKATSFINSVAQELGYEHSDTLEQLLDELDTEAINQLDDDDSEGDE